MEAHFLLFDIDGVLLNPKGYRQATKDTIKHIGARYGLRIITVSEFELAAFESQGITSEWDMIPLYFLAWIESCLSLFPQQIAISNLNNLAYSLGGLDEGIIEPINIINKFGTLLKDGKAPADSVRDEILNGNNSNCLPLIYQFAPWLINDFLTDTRDPLISETTKLFQNLILGNILFEEICEISAEIETPSYLLKHDETIINDESKRILIKKLDQKKINISAMTARPSQVPDLVKAKKYTGVFFPEAEIAIKRIGLNALSAVGYGTMKLLGERFGFNGDYFLKPSPVHALIALAMACNIEFSLIYDYLIANKDLIIDYNVSDLDLKTFLPGWVIENDVYLHIFEDSQIGIRAVRSMNEILINNGLKSHVISYGISSDDQKISALNKENALIFPDINKALSFCFERFIV